MNDLQAQSVPCKWTHDALMNDLAGYLRGPDTMVWCDMQLGPSGSPRPDVFTLRKSYSKPMPTAFECKVSRSDLRSDTTSGKWQSYLAYAGSVTFAVPDGLCTVADIPTGCGLIVRKNEVWRYARRATIQNVRPPFDMCMKMLIDGVSRVSKPIDPRPRPAELWKENERVRKKFGEAVAKCARDLASAQMSALDEQALRSEAWKRVDREAAAHKEYLISQAKAQAAEFEAIRIEICQWLELDADTSKYAVQRAISALRAECVADERVDAVETKLANARRALASATQALADG